jgi:hypothetical protein
MGATVSRSVRKFMKDVSKDLDTKLKDSAMDMATAAIQESPVQTGAFVTSWTVSDRSNRGRSRTSRGRPKRSESEAKTEASLLVSNDIDALPEETRNIYLNNRAPHTWSALKNRPDFFENVKARAFEALKARFRDEI